MKFEEVEKEVVKRFSNDETFIIDSIYSGNSDVLMCRYCYINGLSEPDKIAEMLIKPLKNNPQCDVKKYIVSANISTENNTENAIKAMLEGDCLIFIPYEEKVFVLDTKKNIYRSISEPSNEKTIKGPKDGFIESILTNIALVRKHLKTDDLCVKFKNLDGEDNNRLALIYLESKIDKKVLEILNERLEKIKDTKGIGINQLKEKLKDRVISPFKTIGDTERPDFLANKLIYGAFGLIMDGTPVTIYGPYLLSDSFKTPDDYYLNFYYSSINRILRYISFFLTISLPALYLSLLLFHQELLPTKLALSISSSRQGVPFPTMIEMLLLMVMFEVLRETGTKIPSVLGSSLSIVGALVIGQATVDARLVSTSVVVVVASTAVCGLISPKLSAAALIYRLFLFFFSAILGFHGLIVGFLMMAISIISIKSFGKNYVSDMFSFEFKKMKKTYIRLPYRRD